MGTAGAEANPKIGAIVMVGAEAVKPDPAVWLPLLAEYRLTSLPQDAVLEGTLRPDLTAASPEVQAALSEWPTAAHLQSEDGQTRVVLVYRIRDEPRRWPWVQTALLLATLLTTLGAGALMAGLDPFGTRVWALGEVPIPYPSTIDWPVLMVGATFALPFLGVLLAHEMGHYVAAHAHRVRATLPYFVPFPPYFSIIGTLGAFIRLRSPTVRRSALFDIGSAGPLASFALSLPILGVGLGLSEAVPGRATLASPFLIHFAGESVRLGNGVVTHLFASLLGPGAVGDAPILLHPLALVGWLGMFVTALNLLPLGQLDGGHVLYAVSPRRAALGARLFLAALLPLGLVWWGWWAWALIVVAIHRGRIQHARVLQPGPGLGPRRRILGWLVIAVFFLTFVPVPVHL